MFCSTVMFLVLSQKTQWALASTLGLSQQASHTWTSSFDLLGLCTQTWEPQIQGVDRSGGRPYSASNGILPLRAHVTIRFLSHAACLSASPHNDLSRPLACVNAWILLRRVRFRHSTMPFSWGVLWVVSFLAMPTFLRCWSNAPLRYSPLQSDCRTLIMVQCPCVTASMGGTLEHFT
jgi:hypothetical protein